MKNKTTFAIFIAVMLVLGIVSNIISTITFGSFAAYELFYFACLAAAIVLIITEGGVGRFKLGLSIATLGHLVNCLIRSFVLCEGVGRILNLILTGLILVSGLAFIFVRRDRRAIRAISCAASIFLVGATSAVATFNLADGLFVTLNTLKNACLIIQNLSLISTISLATIQLLYATQTDE